MTVSEVKIYAANVYMEDGVIAYGADVVLHSAHLNELAALREELAKAIELAGSNLEAALEFEAYLTAAEQRNEDMLNWLRRQANAEKGSTERSVFIESYNALKKIAETKPTESGASE